MSSERFDFPNASGFRLAAAIDRPSGPPTAYALFAHCFTCGKDNLAASRIAHALADHGVAVLCFDFAGIGASEGEFANAGFSAIPVSRYQDGTGQMSPRAIVLLQRQMTGHRPHIEDDDQTHRNSDEDDRHERDVPVPKVSDVQSDWDAQDLARGKCRLNEAHHTTAHLEREQVRGNGKNDGADDAAEQPGHDPRQKQQVIIRRERAERGTDNEPEIEEEQKSFSIEAISESGRHDAGDTGAECVCRHDLAKSLRTDFEVRHDYRAERRYDHEVQDDRELQEGEQSHDEFLIAGEFQLSWSFAFCSDVTVGGLEICGHPRTRQ
jgi:hypothetical protein